MFLHAYACRSEPQSVLCLLVPFDDMHDTDDDRLCKCSAKRWVKCKSTPTITCYIYIYILSFFASHHKDHMRARDKQCGGGFRFRPGLAVCASIAS